MKSSSSAAARAGWNWRPGWATSWAKKRANITLIDALPSHLWKPLLYEVAAGNLDSYAERLEYLAQGHWHHFRFRLGRMDSLDRACRKCLKLLIVEASDRILPGLSPRLSNAAAERVVEVRKDGMLTADGKFIPASMMVWSAGIKAPNFLKDLDGLETNRINQLMVKPTLQTTRDDNIFALGDCAACPMPDGRNVPPRAQAAHQQASLMAKAICRRFRGKPLLAYVYRDYGSLVALGRHSTVGNLMGSLTGGSIMIEGVLARLVYWSLHKMHQIALHGWLKTTMTTYAHFISTPTRARIKLH